MAAIRVTPRIWIDDSELEERFVLASGPGGQNVNKVSTAVQLRFNVALSPALSEEIRDRLTTLAGRRLTKEGILVLDGRQYRSQERNRADVRERLFDLIRQAATVPRTRKPTKPTKASKRRRIDTKTKHGALKRARGKPALD